MKVCSVRMGIDEPTFFFIHVMKTAGTTFVAHLDRIFPPEQVYPNDCYPGSPAARYIRVPLLAELTAEQRAGIRLYRGHLPMFAADIVGADHMLTLLREPIDRAISHLLHAARLTPRFEGRSLEAVYEDEMQHRGFFVDHQVKQFALRADDGAKSNMFHLTIDEDRFRLAVENLERLSVLGLTERWDEFLAELSRRFGWAFHPLDAMQVNPGPREIPAALRRRIIDDNAADIEFYEVARKLAV